MFERPPKPDELTPLQHVLMQSASTTLNRSYLRVQEIFASSRISFSEELTATVSRFADEDSLTVLDGGCGNGETLRSLRQCFRAIVRMGNFTHLPHLSLIGVDENPLTPELTEKCPVLSRLKTDTPTDDLTFVAADLRDMRAVPSESVHFAFSCATLRYVDDVLRVFEEFYRILKVGGRALLQIEESYFPTSLEDAGEAAKNLRWPSLRKMLHTTPGASNVFRPTLSYHTDKIGAIKCRKERDDGFSGFPYKLDAVVVDPGGASAIDFECFDKRGLYRRCLQPE